MQVISEISPEALYKLGQEQENSGNDAKAAAYYLQAVMQGYKPAINKFNFFIAYRDLALDYEEKRMTYALNQNKADDKNAYYQIAVRGLLNKISSTWGIFCIKKIADDVESINTDQNREKIQEYANANWLMGCLYLELSYSLEYQYPNKYDKKQICIERALKYLESAKKVGCPAAQYMLGYYYAKLALARDQQNWKTAIDNLQDAADKNHAGALYTLGLCCATGQGVSQDWNMAIPYYQQAASLGHADALYALGICYLNGDGVEIDFNRAFEYFKKAAAQEHIDAIYARGICYLNGIGATQDVQKASDCFSSVISIIDKSYYGERYIKTRAAANFRLGACINPNKPVKRHHIENCLLNQKYYYNQAKYYQNPSMEEISLADLMPIIKFNDPFKMIDNLLINLEINDTDTTRMHPTIDIFISWIKDDKVPALLQNDQIAADIIGSYIFNIGSRISHVEEADNFFHAIPKNSIFYLFGLDFRAYSKAPQLSIILRKEIQQVAQNFKELTPLQKQLLSREKLDLAALLMTNSEIIEQLKTAQVFSSFTVEANDVDSEKSASSISEEEGEYKLKLISKEKYNTEKNHHLTWQQASSSSMSGQPAQKQQSKKSEKSESSEETVTEDENAHKMVTYQKS